MNHSLCKAYFDQKLTQCEQLLKLTREVWHLLNSEEDADIADLEEKFLQRTKVVGEIENLDRVYAKDCGEAIKMNEYSHYAARMKEIFTTVQNMDEKIEEILQDLREHLQQEYHQVKSARKVQSAYENTEGGQGVFVYKKR